MTTPTKPLDTRPLVLVTCQDCNGSGLTDHSDGTVSCDICGGYGECWVDEQEAPPDIRVHKEKR